MKKLISLRFLCGAGAALCLVPLLVYGLELFFPPTEFADSAAADDYEYCVSMTMISGAIFVIAASAAFFCHLKIISIAR